MARGDLMNSKAKTLFPTGVGVAFAAAALFGASTPFDGFAIVEYRVLECA